jgi:hypothetical protein
MPSGSATSAHKHGQATVVPQAMGAGVAVATGGRFVSPTDGTVRVAIWLVTFFGFVSDFRHDAHEAVQSSDRTAIPLKLNAALRRDVR